LRFKIDENAPFSVKAILESRGNHQADSVYHEGIAGITDRDLIELCLQEERILITLDTDFSNSLLHPRGTFYGIILLRPLTQGKNVFLQLFAQFLAQFQLEQVVGRVVIVEPHQIHIRWDCV
jgi:predicted nuclease of predicted toxin-antitoxin system